MAVPTPTIGSEISLDLNSILTLLFISIAVMLLLAFFLRVGIKFVGSFLKP